MEAPITLEKRRDVSLPRFFRYFKEVFVEGNPRTGRKNREIERLRAIAVLFIVLIHAPFRQLLPPYFYSSFTGVDLFFVISGFVVSLSFMRELQAGPEPGFAARVMANGRHIGAFYVRRIFRIAPSAFFYVIVFFIASVLLKRAGSISEFAQPENIFREGVVIAAGFYNYALASGAVAGSIPHYWSLAVEEHFYLLAPLLLIAFFEKQRRAVAVLAGIALVLLVFRPMTSGSIYYLSHTRFDSILFGVLLAVLYADYRKYLLWDFEALNRKSGISQNSGIARVFLSRRLRPLLKTFVGIFLCLLLGLLPGVTNTDLLGGTAGGGSPFYSSSVGLLNYTLISTALVLLASLERGWIFEIPLLSRVLEYIGSRSFAIYLSHWLIVVVYNDLFARHYEELPSFWKLTIEGYYLQFAGYIVLVLAISELSYRLVERPFMNLGGLFAKAIRAGGEGSRI